jgi:hypothetical protein
VVSSSPPMTGISNWSSIGSPSEASPAVQSRVARKVHRQSSVWSRFLDLHDTASYVCRGEVVLGRRPRKVRRGKARKSLEGAEIADGG